MKFAKVDQPNLFKALAIVSEELENEKLIKSSKGYGYKYANLATVLDYLKPALKKAGLVVTQGGDNGDFRGDINTATVTTFVVHVDSGEYLSTQVTIPLNKPLPQDYGSAITYARRYTLLSIFGLVAEDDDASPEESDKRVLARAERETKASEYKPGKEAQEYATTERKTSGRTRGARKKTFETATDAELEAMAPKGEEIKVPAPTTKPTISVPKIELYSEEQFKPLEEESAEAETEAPKRSRPVGK